MLNFYLLATLGFLAASLAALHSGLSARRRERSFLLLSEKPQRAPFRWPELFRRLSHRDGRPLRRGARAIFLAAIGVAIFALTRNPLLALLPWPAFHLLRGILEKRKKRGSETRKEEQVLELIDSLGQSLRSGLSLQQSLEICVEDVGEEMRVEITRLLKELRLGGGLEETLSQAAASTSAPSLKLTFTVLSLMHGKGGDLPHILERLRRRVAGGLEARREARILTSQSRVSGYLVSALPPVFLLLQAALNPQSLRPLLTSPTGNLIIAVALALNAGAFLIIRKLVSPGV